MKKSLTSNKTLIEDLRKIPKSQQFWTWNELNDAVMAAPTEAECQVMLKKEQLGSNRYAFIMRIHSRINHLRRARERAELASKAPKR